MTNININLEQRHIDRGVAFSQSECPAALAITEALPGVRGCCVGAWRIWLYRASDDYRGECVGSPRAITNFIRDFDAGRDVEPFTFELEVPEWAVRR